MTATDTFRAHLATGSTTVARVWILTRRDGVAMGFTDHDRDLALDGVKAEALAGLEGSDLSTGLGLAADDLDARGALSSDRITEADLAAGLYDGAEVAVWDVDWTDPDGSRILRGVYTVGEVERGPLAFRAELRSRAAGLGRTEGRRYLATCDAALGDARCGVDLDVPAFTGSGAVAAVDGVRLTVSGIQPFASGWFARGRLTWSSGANAGAEAEIRAHIAGTDAAALLLRASPRAAVQVGDAFTIRAGCDKSWETCRAKFSNGDRFRGFPHIPPETLPLEYARSGDPANDGGSRFA